MSYVLILGTVLLGLFSLYKDWRNYKHTWVRRGVGAVLLFVGAFSVVKQYRDNRAAQIRETTATKNVHTLTSEGSGLKGKVNAANEAQTQNTKVFLENLNRLSDKVGALQTQVETDELRKQLAGVQSDLQKTQKALTPGPKAKLILSFAPHINPPAGTGEPAAVTDKSLPLSPEGSVHVELTVLNLSEADAIDVGGELVICTACKFAKEPLGVQRRSELPDTQRFIEVPHLLSLVHSSTITFDVIPPSVIGTFKVGFVYRCRTCVVEREPSAVTIHLVR
jgi:hypothetical protein